METGEFYGRKAKVIPVELPPPPPTITLELTKDEALIIKEACYFYWAARPDTQRAISNSAWWHNPTQLSDNAAAKVAQDVYDEYMSNVY